MPTYLAPAKINLYLHVTGKRTDGYHLLDSLVVFAKGLSDKINIEMAEDFSFSVSGDFANEVPQDNLVTKAAMRMAKAVGREPNVRIHLEKNIPAGAGLGGGSADAAATIKGLESLWGVQVEKTARDDLLLSLGADVPVCYHAAPCRFRGIGEIIEDAPEVPPFHALIIWPNRHSETKAVFAKRTGGFTDEITMPSSFSAQDDFISFLACTDNDLTDAACAIEPAIAEALDFVKSRTGCLFARMSGSGSAVLGLFQTHENCALARSACQYTHPAWFAASITI